MEAKTKEEILVNQGQAWEYLEWDLVSPVPAVYEAMEEYARQEAIKLLRWISANNIERSTSSPDKWYESDLVPFEYFSDEELYNLFKQSTK